LIDWLRYTWKRLHSRFRAIPGYCKRCGRDMVPVWATEDFFYRAVVPTGEETCLTCFDEMARAGGVVLVWEPKPVGQPTASERVDRAMKELSEVCTNR